MAKKLKLIILLLALFVTQLSAQNIFFPTQPGTVLLYQQTDENGKITGYTRYTVTSVTGSGNNMTVYYLLENMDENRQVTLEFPGKTHIRDGRIIFDIEQMIAPYLQSSGLGLEAEFSGTFMEIPTDFSPGQRFDDTEGTIRIGRGILGMRVRMSVTDAKCIKIEDVTVPAGTFNSHKITQTINNTVLLRTTSVRLISWYVHNIGTVKNRTYDNRGRLQSVSKLVEIIRP
jgi:hypothetical protein